MNTSFSKFAFFVLATVLSVLPVRAAAPAYSEHVAPLLKRYCAGCHNADDHEGGLVLDSYAGVLKGGKNGAALTPGNSEQSRLIRLLTGKGKPAMPPKDNDAPKPAEIALLKAWIDAGAKGPDGGEPDRTTLVTPKIKPTAPVRATINSLAVARQGDVVGLARASGIELKSLAGQTLRTIPALKPIAHVSFSADGKLVVGAGGETGLFGEAWLWNVTDGALVKTFRGHTDSLYSAALSPDGSLLATAGYDRLITLWDVAQGTPLRTCDGHNGPVFDVKFHPAGKLLASASGDRTVKLWNVATGARLDTLNQSVKELYTLGFSPDGKRLAAGGVDNRIRVWQISDSAKEGTNPLLYSVFAHEAPILRLAYSPNGRTIVSTGEDRAIKVWNAGKMTLRAELERQPEWCFGLDVAPDNKTLAVGRLDGSQGRYTLPVTESDQEDDVEPLSPVPLAAFVAQPALENLPKVAEVEPNDAPQQATPLAAPGIATGRIHSETAGEQGKDVDLFRFAAKAGEPWIIETNAARSGSPLDSKLEVLNADGRQVERVLFRAVRDTEITFRGINSTQVEVRLVNWEEMELNEFLYMEGEVGKLFRAPRGPDSGFNLYPNAAPRFTYFDTSPRSHPLGEPSYIVVPYPPGTKLPNNGLPVFTHFFENDDDAQRKLGKDSRLTFAAPADGNYLIRVSDIRGFSGDGFKYELAVRRPKSDFKVTLTDANPTVSAGSGKSFTAKLERLDSFDGPVRLDITGLPPGFAATTPLWLEAGQIEAKGVVHTLLNTPLSTEANWSQSKVTATAKIGGQSVTKEIGSLGTIKLADKPKLLARLTPTGTAITPTVPSESLTFTTPPEVVIEPGAMITCELSIERFGFNDRVQLEIENLPHGVIVEDIGLNGVLIPEKQTQRTIFLRAAPWVPETTRPFFAVAKAEGNQSSPPMLLRVRKPAAVAGK